jgi:hypothetical protein
LAASATVRHRESFLKMPNISAANLLNEPAFSRGHLCGARFEFAQSRE